MLPLVSLALFLFCFALLFSMFSPPLRVHYYTSSLDFCLSVSNLTDSTISVHGFIHSVSIPVRFLSRLRQFACRMCAWNSLFCVSKITREVATCPSLEKHQPAHRFVAFSTGGGQWIPNPLKSWLNPLSILVSPSSAFSVVRSGAPRSNAIRSFCMVYLLNC